MCKEIRFRLCILAIDHFRIINGIDIDYKFKWKMNTSVSITLKITTVQLKAYIRPTELVPVVD